MMFTVVYTPGSVCTLINVSLRTVTLKLSQPNLSTAGTVDVVSLRSNVSAFKTDRKVTDQQQMTDYIGSLYFFI